MTTKLDEIHAETLAEYATMAMPYKKGPHTFLVPDIAPDGRMVWAVPTSAGLGRYQGDRFGKAEEFNEVEMAAFLAGFTVGETYAAKLFGLAAHRFDRDRLLAKHILGFEVALDQRPVKDDDISLCAKLHRRSLYRDRNGLIQRMPDFRDEVMADRLLTVAHGGDYGVTVERIGNASWGFRCPADDTFATVIRNRKADAIADGLMRLLIHRNELDEIDEVPEIEP